MSLLKDALRQARSVRPQLRLPDVPRIMVVAERLAEAGSSAECPRPGRDYNAIARDLLKRARGRETLSRRELRDAAWSLWTTDPALASYPDILERVLEAIDGCDSARPGRALASSYLASFEPERPGIGAVSRRLTDLAPRLGHPWDGLQSELAIFDLQEGPERVAAAAIRERRAPTDVLKTRGLGALGARSGFAKACADIVLMKHAEGQEPDPDRRLDLVQAVSLAPDGQLYFTEHGPLVADALLRPFGNRIPEKGIRDRYLRVLLRLFGDPRLQRARWTRMPGAEAIVRRWLTEQSLRQFLDVVDQVAVEHMWKYRRAFWEAVYSAGLISDAWVIFDDDGAAVAHRAFGQEASFGRFKRGGTKQIEPGHSVLLLRIGRGIVADWSHNGKCNIWSDAESPTAPRLYRPYYTSDDVRIPGDSTDSIHAATFTTSHIWSETYNWQQKVASKIHQMTRVRVPLQHYRV